MLSLIIAIFSLMSVGTGVEHSGYWWWTWSNDGSCPSNTNLAIAFSGYVMPEEALSNSAHLMSKLPGRKFISLGGGNAAGKWTASALDVIVSAVKKGTFAGYNGIAYDIEEGDVGLLPKFTAAFKATKEAKLTVLVTISHSAPYGFSDAPKLMRAFLRDPNIDFMSPQLYTSGNESQNDYNISHGVQWAEYKYCHAKLIPSIVQSGLYKDCLSYFRKLGINTTGYIQWKNQNAAEPSENDLPKKAHN